MGSLRKKFQEFLILAWNSWKFFVILDPLRRKKRKRSGNKSCLPCCWRLPVVCVVLGTHNPPYYNNNILIEKTKGRSPEISRHGNILSIIPRKTSCTWSLIVLIKNVLIAESRTGQWLWKYGTKKLATTGFIYPLATGYFQVEYSEPPFISM